MGILSPHSIRPYASIKAQHKLHLQHSPLFGSVENRECPRKLSKRFQIHKTALKAISAFMLTWCGIWGTGSTYDKVVGDGVLPELHELTPEEDNGVPKNTTEALYKELSHTKQPVSSERIWKELQPTLNIVHQLSPEIADWVKQLYETNPKELFLRLHIALEDRGTASKYKHHLFSSGGELIFYPNFFMYSDREKTALIAHEFRHSRQNKGKFIAHILSPKQIFNIYRDMLTNLTSGYSNYIDEQGSYVTPIEEEAYRYQAEACKKLKIQNTAASFLQGPAILQSKH